MNPQLTPRDAYEQLKKKSILHMKDEVFDEKMVTHMKDIFVEFLQRENKVMTRNEKRRLFKDALQEIFDDILTNI